MRLPRRSQARSDRPGGESVPLVTLETLFHTTFGSVRRSLARLGVPSRDQSDLAQDVFLAAYRNLERYDPKRAPMQAWLNGITVNLASHYREKAQNRREMLVPEPGCGTLTEAPGAEEQLLSHEAGLLVQDVLLRVEPKLRDVMVAHDVEGVPMTEIAAALGIPTSTAYKWLYRARHAFRVAFERRLRRDRTPAAVERPPDQVCKVRDRVTLIYGVGAKHGLIEAEVTQAEAPPSFAFALVGVWLASLAPLAPRPPKARKVSPAADLLKTPRLYAVRARALYQELAREPSFVCHPG